MTVELFNGKAGHKIPTGSVEEGVLWLHVEATDAAGRIHHLPTDRKGFDGEEHTIAGRAKAYFDPKGRMTICQWNTASLGVDYRIGPRETNVETFTWRAPRVSPGRVQIRAVLGYRRIAAGVAAFLRVPEEDWRAIGMNAAETWITVRG